MMRIWTELRNSTQLTNSLLLLLATGALAGFGFVFWTIVAHAYSSSTVGVATTLLAVSSLVSLLGLAGFDTTLVRFLPGAQNPQAHVRSSLTVVSVTSAVLSAGCVFILPAVSSSLSFVTHHWWYGASFVFFTVITSLNTLTNAIFLAHKKALTILSINILFGAAKVVLPLLWIHPSAMHIFLLAGISQLVGLLCSLAALWRQFGYKPTFGIDSAILKKVQRYSFSVYISSLLNLLPPTLVPLIIVHSLRPDNAAYYYISFTIASVLYTISYAAMQSAFAEGSHNEAAFSLHLRKAAKLIGVLLVPAMVILFASSSFVLGFFGKDYAEQGRGILQLLTLSALPVAAYSALGVIFKITRNLRGIIAMNTVYALLILSISYVGLPSLGVSAIGWAWLAGNIGSIVTGLIFAKQPKVNIVKEALYGKIAATGE
ncbi:MAG TPA: oligosaccharide flippase family protein [Candidatus Saccharimonadales bacterium]|nr:oligosaccharide flippase family protein [Candidatus Saccharimonadales bacterium]